MGGKQFLCKVTIEIWKRRLRGSEQGRQPLESTAVQGKQEVLLCNFFSHLFKEFFLIFDFSNFIFLGSSQHDRGRSRSNSPYRSRRSRSRDRRERSHSPRRRDSGAASHRRHRDRSPAARD